MEDLFILLTDDYKVCVGVRGASSIGDTTLMAGKDQIFIPL